MKLIIKLITILICDLLKIRSSYSFFFKRHYDLNNCKGEACSLRIKPFEPEPYNDGGGIT